MDMDHNKQRQLWENEHKQPFVLLQMDKKEVSSGIKRFLSWLEARNHKNNLTGLEMGCGKGRNSIGLAKQSIKMAAFDFSKNAITEAKKRAEESGVENSVNFIVQDATIKWPFKSDSFDLALDVFASVDIESFEGRSFARDEFKRVLKKGGFLLVYTLSTDDEFHKEMLKEHPAKEKNSFIHPTSGKFEKVFDREELLDFYKDFKVMEEQRIEKETEFFGKKYSCRHFWLILQKT